MLHRDGTFEGIFTPAARARIVEELFSGGVEIPSGLLSKAFQVLDAGMAATETKFFSYKGYVKSREVVVDHQTRLAASKEVFSIATLLTREKDPPKVDGTVAMEFDNNTGVLRIVVGAGGAAQALPVSTIRQVHAPPVLTSAAAAFLDEYPGMPKLKGPGPPRLLSELDRILKEDLEEKRILSDEIVD